MSSAAFEPMLAESSTPTAAAGRFRFTPEALKYLRKRFEDDDSPTMNQRAQMAEHIRLLPGNENANIDRVSRYFTCKRQNRNRRTSGQVNSTEADDMEAMLFPNIALDKRIKLDQLHRMHTEPNDEMMAFWAGRLDIEFKDIVDWVKFRCMQPSASPSAHLPTPATSISPPTRHASLPSIEIKQEASMDTVYPLSPAQTPVIARSVPRQDPPAALASNHVDRLNFVQPMSRKAAPVLSKTEQTPAPQVAAVPVPPRPRVPVPRPVIPSSHSMECRTPRTIEEFDSMSAPIVEMLKRFIESYHHQTYSQN